MRRAFRVGREPSSASSVGTIIDSVGPVIGVLSSRTNVRAVGQSCMRPVSPLPSPLLLSSLNPLLLSPRLSPSPLSLVLLLPRSILCDRYSLLDEGIHIAIEKKKVHIGTQRARSAIPADHVHRLAVRRQGYFCCRHTRTPRPNGEPRMTWPFQAYAAEICDSLVPSCISTRISVLPVSRWATA